MTNQFLPFATDGGANVIAQGTYAGLAARDTGFVAGVAISAQLNKVWRQSSAMAAALGTFISDRGGDALDDGDIAALADALAAAIESGSWRTGDVKWTYDVVHNGWVNLNDGTIGDLGSGATTRANADTVNLYTLLWNNVSDGNCPVSSGRGVSAAADFGAGKTIRLPLTRGRVAGAIGTGSGLTARSLGETVGEETHVLTVNELASHTHDANPMRDNNNNNDAHPAAGELGAPQGTFNTTAAGGDDPHNNMQPSTFLRMVVKL